MNCMFKEEKRYHVYISMHPNIGTGCLLLMESHVPVALIATHKVFYRL